MTKSIPLTQGKFALVDDEDYEYLNQWKWGTVKYGKVFYAERHNWPNKNNVKMHRAITCAPAGVDVDHINGDGLDNRRANLRVCTHAENQRNLRMRSDNTTGYKGVKRVNNRFRARLRLNGREVHLGYYATAEEAARAYDDGARRYFGEFARLNFE